MKKHLQSILVLSIIPCVSLMYMSVNKIVLGHIVDNVEVGFYSLRILICIGFINVITTVMMP